MTTYKTMNAIGSAAVKDLYDNAENLDAAVNGRAQNWIDRLGRSRRSLQGFEDAAAVILAQAGYLVPVPYDSGLSMVTANQTVTYDGGTYAPLQSELPFTTSGTFEANKFRLIQGVSGADLASPTGAMMVGFKYPSPDSELENVNAIIEALGVRPESFGAVGNGVDDDHAALTKAIEVAASSSRVLRLSPGAIYRCSQDLIVTANEAVAANDSFHVLGAGPGRLGARFIFSGSASMRIECSNFHLQDFMVTSETGDGIVFVPWTRPGATIGYPVRGYVSGVRAEQCGRDGFVLGNTWIVQFNNCFARYNKRWGLNLDHINYAAGIGCNSFTWVGGEIQGNGDPSAANYELCGGVYHGSSVLTYFCVSIEGNYGHGVMFVGASDNATFQSCYVEKNGLFPEHRDFYHAAVSGPAQRPRNITISGCNHTAINTSQDRSIEMYDVLGLYIKNPTFFGSPSASYTDIPILIGESVTGYSNGWVEGGQLAWSGYTEMLRNECVEYGKPELLSFSFDADAAPGVDTIKRAAIPLRSTDGRRVKVNAVFGFSSTQAGQSARLEIYGGYLPALSRSTAQTITKTGVAATVTESVELTITSTSRAGVIVAQRRIGTHEDDNYVGNVHLLGGTAQVFRGWVR